MIVNNLVLKHKVERIQIMPDEYIKDFDGWHPLKKKIEKECRVPTIRQRDIWWCSIGVNIGVEQDGKNALYERPVLVVRKFNNRHFMGVPLTTQLKDFPLRHNVFYRSQGQVREGQALLSQMRSYDAMRLTRHVAKLGTKQFKELMESIHDMLGGA